jgi:CheY-like chemotaxis protein
VILSSAVSRASRQARAGATSPYSEPQRFDLVLTDEMTPDLTGTELAREIRQLRPDISIILMSGYNDARLSERAQGAGIMDVLRKPLARRDIAEPVARALQTGSVSS